jgi:hypothetical protein
VVDEVPTDLDIVRYWDLAATEKTEFNDPDWTGDVEQLGRLAVTGDHEVGCAPDLDFRYHAGRLSGEPLSTVICSTPIPL